MRSPADSLQGIFVARQQKLCYSKRKGVYDMHLWEQAKNVKIQTGEEIVGNFSLGFEEKIPEETKNAVTDGVFLVSRFSCRLA